jgi:hypothetical protein
MWQQYWWLILLGIIIVPLICITAFSLWLRQRPDVDLDKGVKCWDIFVKLISALTIVVSGAMIFGKYIDQQRVLEGDRVQQQRRELDLKNAEFLRQKLQFDTERHQRKRTLFDEVKGLAAKLASTETPDKAVTSRFEEMYYASLIGIEQLNGPVEHAMVRFRQKLKGLPGAPEASLDQLSLSTACEIEAKESIFPHRTTSPDFRSCNHHESKVAAVS